jgi:hypothetical protein
MFFDERAGGPTEPVLSMPASATRDPCVSAPVSSRSAAAVVSVLPPPVPAVASPPPFPPAAADRAEAPAWADSIVHATPWWSASIAAHGLMLLAAVFIALDASARRPEPSPGMIRLGKTPAETRRLDFAPAVFPDRKPERTARAEEAPVFAQEAEEAEHDETADESLFRSVRGEEADALASRPLRGAGFCDRIGVAGAAGRYAGRLGGKRNLVARGGGSAATEEAVLAGLLWLARHQEKDGRWGARAFAGRCGEGAACAGPGEEAADTGVTALAVLAFLGAGYTPVSRDMHGGACFGAVVREGLEWLMQAEDRGPAGDPAWGNLYNRSIAALALSEAAGLTGSERVCRSAQRAIDRLVAAQNPGAGWRYTARCGDSDTSVTGWCVMALKSAELSGLRVPRSSYQGARAFLDRVTDSDHHVGYVRPPSRERRKSDALTAVGVMSRIFIDREKTARHVKGGAELAARGEPSPQRPDFYAWYYVALALFQYDGPDGPLWSSWNERMKAVLTALQRGPADGCAAGSWDPSDTWSWGGGRVYATAINVLTLEVYYRYESVFGSAKRS